MTQVRCAIYTRKSSEEGLAQDFNSLDAQREACAAYVLSQASEGWKLIDEHYDDGGLSGGTLERPALQRLLKDVNEGRIDIIVVYKVDRLTRSLLDFAKLVEAFDHAGVSFVSVTQSFNTTTSMGRLTLNMLLSFAQFEREITAERIRDKIAASKAKGMWMGGTPPLGYEPDGRNGLTIVEEHAALIREIYASYIRLGNVRLVAEELDAEKLRTPLRTTRKGTTFGGCTFTRGQLYHLLRNPIYAGDIAHKGKVYPGNHTAIIARDTWEAVQQQLSENIRGRRRSREASSAILAGKLFDESGEPLIPVHTSKPGPQGSDSVRTRYRYYVSRSAHHGENAPSAHAIRIPAQEIEQAVFQGLAQILDDPLELIARTRIVAPPSELARITQRANELAAALRQLRKQIARHPLERATVHPDRLELEVSVEGLATLLDVPAAPDTPQTFTHRSQIRLTRTGHSLRLVDARGVSAAPRSDPVLIGQLIQARKWWKKLARSETDIASLARSEGVSASWITRVVRLAFLAPEVVEAILGGRVRVDIDGRALLAARAISANWGQQAQRFLPQTDHANHQDRVAPLSIRIR